MSNLGILPLAGNRMATQTGCTPARSSKDLETALTGTRPVVISLLSMALLYALLVLAQTHTLFGSDRAGESERTGAAALLFSGNVALLVLCAYWRTDPEVFSS